MSSVRRVISLAVVVVAVMFVVGVPASASAAVPVTVGQDSLQDCVDQAENHDGEPPTCTEVDGHYEASWPGEGIPGEFVLILVVGILVSVGVLIWKVSTARTLAARSGMDPGLATQMTLLSDDGLEATYLAANLRQPAAAAHAPPAERATTAKRLVELKGLLDEGLVTQSEYDERRRAIIDGV